MAWIRGTIQQADRRLPGTLAHQSCANIRELGHRELSGMAWGVGASQFKDAPMPKAALAAA